MNSRCVLAGVLLLGLAAGIRVQSAPAGPGSLLSWHSGGRQALARGTNATRLKVVDQLPATEAFRRQIATNLARAPRKAWEKDLPADIPDGAELLRPLIADVLSAESYGEVLGPIGQTETAIAVELTDARAAAWTTNLWQLATLWKQGTPQAATRDGGSGWVLRRQKAPNRLELIRAGQWVVLGFGPEKLTRLPALVQQIKATGRPAPKVESELLDLRADAPALTPWIPIFGTLGLPPFHLSMRGNGEHVKTEAKLNYAKPFVWKYEPWQIPTNFIGDSPAQLTSFTAGRGIAPLVQSIPGFPELGLTRIPGQFTAWANLSASDLSRDQCRMNFAVPYANAEGVLRQMAGKLPTFVERNLGQYVGDIYYASNQNHVFWGLPFIQPHLRAVTNAGMHFLQGGIFPLHPRQTPAPAAMFAQLGTRTNLLYYDYEITHQRIHHGVQLFQLLSIASRRFGPGTNSPVKLWLSAVVDELRQGAPSETVTEIAQTAPSELTLVRKSHLGFTGFELASFSAFLDSPGFPFRYVPPKAVPLPKDKPAAARTNVMPTGFPPPGGGRKP